MRPALRALRRRRPVPRPPGYRALPALLAALLAAAAALTLPLPVPRPSASGAEVPGSAGGPCASAAAISDSPAETSTSATEVLAYADEANCSATEVTTSVGVVLASVTEMNTSGAEMCGSATEASGSVVEASRSEVRPPRPAGRPANRADDPVPVPDETWDALADCESGGDWQADTGNGYYGGLQIWPPTWREAGGLSFAERPDLATRREQITVAEEILHLQGWEAWSYCARMIGVLDDRPAPRPAIDST